MYTQVAKHLYSTPYLLVELPPWEYFIDPANWRLIPTRTGTILLGGMKLRSSDDVEVILVRRITDDSKAGVRALPANNPYEQVIETVITGGFTETRYFKAGTKPFPTPIHCKPGESSYVPRAAYRMITKLTPGTLTLLTCTGFNDTWSYLDPDTGKLVSQEENMLPRYSEFETKLNQR
jgi:hypothetical protein